MAWHFNFVTGLFDLPAVSFDTLDKSGYLHDRIISGKRRGLSALETSRRSRKKFRIENSERLKLVVVSAQSHVFKTRSRQHRFR